jgi:hypothetical protein
MGISSLILLSYCLLLLQIEKGAYNLFAMQNKVILALFIGIT